jgi:glycosidase
MTARPKLVGPTMSHLTGHAAPGGSPAQRRPRRRPSVAGRSTYFVLTDRFAHDSAAHIEACSGDGWCGGTIRGLLRRLDYIAGLGFECVWISPITQQPTSSFGSSGSGYHGYWTEDWYAMDPRFGTPDEVRGLSRELKSRGMCLILDIVANHVRPVHSAADLARVRPFDQPEHYHMLMRQPAYSSTHGGDAGGGDGGGEDGDAVARFDAYARHPVAAFSSFASAYCGPGDFRCPGYDPAVINDGWFYDLADLNQSHPYVRRELLQWVRYMVQTYEVDALRLDTAAYMPISFLAELQQAAEVEIIGEVAAHHNLSFHASFTRGPASTSGAPVLAGALNFPLYHWLVRGFCGVSGDTGGIGVGGIGVGGADGGAFDGGAFDGGGTSPREGPDAMAWSSEGGPARRPPRRPSLRPVGAIVERQRRERYASLDLLGNFLDNHDFDRIGSACASDTTRIRNALAFVFLARGMPLLYMGTEQGAVGLKSTFNQHGSNRDALWASGYDTAHPMYRFVARLNAVRRQYLPSGSPPSADGGGVGDGIDGHVVNASDATLIISRGTAEEPLLVLVNNRPSRSASAPMLYCVPPHFRVASPPEGKEWQDVLAWSRSVEGGSTPDFARVSARARAEECAGGDGVWAVDGEPKVLVLLGRRQSEWAGIADEGARTIKATTSAWTAFVLLLAFVFVAAGRRQWPWAWRRRGPIALL